MEMKLLSYLQKKKKKEEDKIKILAASDIHGDLELVKKLAKKAKKNKVDAVILCGDLTLSEINIEGLFGPFLKEGIKNIYFVHGNHETLATANFWKEVYKPYVKNMHAYATKIKNTKVGILGYGGANIGVFDDDENLEEILTKVDEKLKDVNKKILITHAPPFGTKIDFLGTHVGSKNLRKAIEKIKPDLVLCGHIHETFGLEDKIGKTKIINVGREGKILII